MNASENYDDPYIKLVRYYDIENIDLVEDLPAYQTLADRFGEPILDVGCGTGRVTFFLTRLGLHVTAIDISRAMLERAKMRAEREAPSTAALITWHEADVLQLALEGRFSLAIYTFNGFMHLLDQRQQITALKQIAGHLRPGGGLAIDLPNPVEMFLSDNVPGLVLERSFVDPQTGDQVMQQSLARINRATQTMNVTWVYDRVQVDGRIQRDMVPLELRYTMAAEMRLLLERAGFGQVEMYGDYAFSPYEENSPRLFVVATRTEADS